MLRSLVGLACGATMLLAASVSKAQCSKDTDCKGDRVCEAGACVAPSGPSAPPPAKASDVVPSAASEAAPATAGDPANALAAQVPPRSEAALPRQERPKLRRYSTGMMAGGIVMISFVPVALIVAGLANNKQTVCETGGVSIDFNDQSVETYEGVDCSTYDKTIYGGLITAVVLAGAGIPLLVIGSKKVPAATATITPWATPRGAGLGLRLNL